MRLFLIPLLCSFLAANAQQVNNSSPSVAEPTPVVIRDQDIPEQYLKKEFVHNGLKVPYRIAETNAGKTAEKAVLVLFLHGMNGMGTDNEKPMQLEPGPKYLYKHFYKKGERAIVVVPQLANGSWKSYGKALKALLDELIASDRNIDPRRVYVTGTSLGGYGTLDMVRLFPNFFAAAMPVAIKAPQDWTGLTSTPLCIVSGQAEGDQTVRINALQKQGGTVKYWYRADANHGWTCQSSFTEDCLKWVFGFKTHRSE